MTAPAVTRPSDITEALAEAARDGARAPVVTAVHLSAFRRLRARTVGSGPVTVVTGPSGSGKSTVLRVHEALSRLAGGDALGEVFPQRDGEPSPYVPQEAQPDRQGRRGFRIGCTVEGPAGALRFDVAVQAEPELRVVGERLATADGATLLSTALRNPERRTVEVTCQATGPARALRTPFPDDRLALPLLPLRMAGTTGAEQALLVAAEQVVVALRSAFACDPVPARMREPVLLRDGRLRGDCANLADVLHRTRTECATRHAALVAAVREGCAEQVVQLRTERCGEGRLVRAVLERERLGTPAPLEWLGDGELRFAGLALVLLTGPGVLRVDTVEEVPAARQAMTVLADGLDRALDGSQAARLLSLAVRMSERGHVRLLATGATDGPLARAAAECAGVSLVDLGASARTTT